jgi:hypothetical protein
MGGSIYFQLARGKGSPLICRRSSSGRPAFSLVLLEELAPARRHVEYYDPRFGEDGAVGARPMDDLGAAATTCRGPSNMKKQTCRGYLQ